MKITIRVKSIYGLETYYPACPAAELFAKIAGTKTITAHAIADIRALGYEIAVKTDAPKVLSALAITEA